MVKAAVCKTVIVGSTPTIALEVFIMLVALMIIFGISLLLIAITEMSHQGFLLLLIVFIVGLLIDKIYSTIKSKKI